MQICGYEIIAFLSCLFGRKRFVAIIGQSGSFLSCLFGRKQVLLLRAGGVAFLSCLFGRKHGSAAII